jgi:proteic killer suppression protein
MITSIANQTTQDIYDCIGSKKARKIPEFLHSKACRLMDQLDAAETLEDMKMPPGNRFEPLSGDLCEYFSVRINKQWRVIFKWDEAQNNAYDVYIGDYHKG